MRNEDVLVGEGRGGGRAFLPKGYDNRSKAMEMEKFGVTVGRAVQSVWKDS